MAAREELWQELEKSLTSLIDCLATKVDDVTRETLKGFVQNREYGVAIEWLHSYIVERWVRLPPKQDDEVRRISKLAGIKLSQA